MVLSCSYQARGWREGEVVLDEVKPGKFQCHYNLGALHGEGNQLRQRVCNHNYLLSDAIYLEHAYQQLCVGPYQRTCVCLVCAPAEFPSWAVCLCRLRRWLDAHCRCATGLPRRTKKSSRGRRRWTRRQTVRRRGGQ